MPWDDIINPLWTELVSHLEEAWLALNSGFIHPEERLPLAYLPGAIACHIRWIAFKLPRADRNSLQHHCLCLLPLLALPALGRWGPVAIAVTGYRRLSGPAYNAFPALAAGIRLLAHVPCLYQSVANSQQHLLRTLLSLCAAQCSIHLLISSHNL